MINTYMCIRTGRAHMFYMLFFCCILIFLAKGIGNQMYMHDYDDDDDDDDDKFSHISRLLLCISVCIWVC